MSIADVASRLYTSSAYRNTSVVKALADSVKMNLKFRFSLVGMAAALTGSQTLYQIAQQKFLISDEEKKQAKEEIHFKKYVVTSISTLSKQVAIIESIVEKNSLMINAIYNDLGYFKGQRKSNTMSYSGLKAVRVPVSSRTVKGKIDIINAEIAALKGIRLAEADAKQKKILKETEKKEKDKQRGLIGAAVGAALGGTAAILGGAGVGVAAAAAGTAALAGAAVSSKIVRQAIGSAVPLIGKALKVSALGTLALDAYGRVARRSSGKAGVQLGEDKDYINEFDPYKNPISFQMRRNEIELRKSFDALLEEFSKPIDQALIALFTLYAAKGAYDLAGFLKKFPKIAKYIPNLPGLAVPGAAVPAAAGGAGAVGAVGAAGAGAVGAAAGGAGMAARYGWSTATAPAAGTTSRIPKRFLDFMKKLSEQKWTKGLIKGGTVLTAVSGVLNLVGLLNSFSLNTNSQQFKDEFTSNVSGLITAGGGALGAVAGGLLGGPAAPITAILGGIVGGVGSGFFADYLANKIFEYLYSGYTGEADPYMSQHTAPDSMPGFPTETTYASKGTSFKDTDFSQVQANIMMAEGTFQTDKPYNTVYGYGKYGQPSKLLTEMTIGDVAKFQKDVLIPNTKGKVPGTDLGTGAVGAYQFTYDTLVSLAKEEFGSSWYSKKFTEENQDRLAKRLFDQRKGNDAKLAATWAYFSNLDEQGGAALRAQRGIGPSGPEAMLAGAEGGFGSMRDAQLLEFFGKEFEKADRIQTEAQAAQDMGARHKLDMLEEVVIQSKKQTAEQLATKQADMQKILDMKRLEDVNYMDDNAFDDYLVNLKSA